MKKLTNFLSLILTTLLICITFPIVWVIFMLVTTIRYFIDKFSCGHRWIRQVSDSAHFKVCAYCGKEKY